jgi:hypothetical protein
MMLDIDPGLSGGGQLVITDHRVGHWRPNQPRAYGVDLGEAQLFQQV